MTSKRRRPEQSLNLQPALSHQGNLAGCNSPRPNQQLSDRLQLSTANATGLPGLDKADTSSVSSSCNSTEQTFQDDSSEYQKYLVEYTYEGSRWGLEVSATSFEDAQARVRRLSSAEVLGEVKATIPVPENWVMRIRKWLGLSAPSEESP